MRPIGAPADFGRFYGGDVTTADKTTAVQAVKRLLTNGTDAEKRLREGMEEKFGASQIDRGWIFCPI